MLVISECEHCGRSFPQKRPNSYRLRYCSQKCGGKGKQERRKAAFANNFWARAQKTDGCWLWTGVITPSGYGQVSYGRTETYQAHRIAWQLTNGPIPEGKWVLHRCDVRRCVRPDHLWLGTHEDNMRDMAVKRRAASGERNGAFTHPERRPVGERSGAFTHPESRVRGERHHSAKLRESDVTMIRQRYAAGGTSMRALASDFGISLPVISKIVRRELWTHVA